VGTRLFDRTTRRVDLTVVGEQFFEDVRKILGEIDQSLQRIEDGLFGQGWVKIVGSPAVLKGVVIPSLVGLRQRYPKVRVSLVEAGATEIYENVMQGNADFGVGSVGFEQESKLYCKALFLDKFCLVAALDHPLLQQPDKPLDIADLHEYDFIGLTENTLIDQYLGVHPAAPESVKRPVMRVSNPTLLSAAIASKLGISVLTVLSCHFLGSDKLSFRLFGNSGLERRIQLLSRPNRSLSPPAKIVWDEIYKSRLRTKNLSGLTILD